MEWLAILPIARHQRRGHHAHRRAHLVRPTSPSRETRTDATPRARRFTTRETKEFGLQSSFRYTKVLVLIVESAMIYSFALIVEITLYFIGSNAFYIVYDPIAQLTVRPPPLSLPFIPSLTHARFCRASSQR